MKLMAGSNKHRNSRIESFFENDIFIDELNKINGAAETLDDDILDIEVIKLRKRWKLSWDYHETIVNFLENGEVDYSLGGPDIRIIDYKAETILPSDSPHDEYRIMDSLKDTRRTGVHIKLPRDINKTTLLDFIKENYNLIEQALDNNFENRLPHQSPEQQTKRKVHIFRLSEQGKSVAEIARLKGDDPRVIRHIIKEYKEKIST